MKHCIFLRLLSLIADWHEGKSRSLAVGVHMTGLYVGQAIGGLELRLLRLSPGRLLFIGLVSWGLSILWYSYYF